MYVALTSWPFSGPSEHHDRATDRQDRQTSPNVAQTYWSFSATSVRCDGAHCWRVSSCCVTSSAHRQLTSSWMCNEALKDRTGGYNGEINQKGNPPKSYQEITPQHMPVYAQWFWIIFLSKALPFNQQNVAFDNSKTLQPELSSAKCTINYVCNDWSRTPKNYRAISFMAEIWTELKIQR